MHAVCKYIYKLEILHALNVQRGEKSQAVPPTCSLDYDVIVGEVEKHGLWDEISVLKFHFIL